MKYYCKNCGSEFEQGGYIPARNSLVVMNWDCSNCDGGKLDTFIPSYETVAQWEARRGRKYPDSAPVYLVPKNLPANRRESGIHLQRYGALQKSGLYFIVVATEAGAPPVDWRPE
jgi:hypothetical protein